MMAQGCQVAKALRGGGAKKGGPLSERALSEKKKTLDHSLAVLFPSIRTPALSHRPHIAY